MFPCPHCNKRLINARNDYGQFWACPDCGGRMVSIALLRRMIDNENVGWIWAQGREGKGEQKRPCPLCRRPMIEVKSGNAPSAPNLDVCRFCSYAWFDPDEFEALRFLPALDQDSRKSLREMNAGINAFGVPRVSPKTLSGMRDPAEEVREKFAIAKIKALQEQSRDKPDEWWKMIPAFLGIPVEISGHKIYNIPWITWLLAALATGISIFAFSQGRALIEGFGFIPSQFSRYYGLTLITPFFLHGGWFHLLSNMYFLLTFGDNVEDFLGKKRFALLAFLATISGNILHGLFNLESTIPCIGASGGISGLIAFYVLKFPDVKLGFYYWLFWRPYWIKISALGFFILWIFLQLIGVYYQLNGFSNVSALAHLGGVTIGVVFYIIWRKKA
ncbi:rhomboid family intramembrane serine protease [Candidatus Sumerlaeota bacterium]|nr:rhomboid family intramembrane serine protease [Candidatus Sumerlaeota bacterium]